ncbi:MAG: WGxxGxxG family protein [Allosphingosinicella sp.]|uniref:WGxxGxxG family protein n=1 Tax=Allosphingosinicella sp. TaxID=2823234 RepID=UPI00395562FB
MPAIPPAEILDDPVGPGFNDSLFADPVLNEYGTAEYAEGRRGGFDWGLLGLLGLFGLLGLVKRRDGYVRTVQHEHPDPRTTRVHTPGDEPRAT